MTGPQRGQSEVVGVALLLGITVIAMAGLTAGIGTLVEGNAAAADTERVASGFDSALDPIETTGRNSGRLTFASGRLSTVERQLRVLNDSGVRRTVNVGGLVFEHESRQVNYVGDAIVRRSGQSTWLRDPPPLTESNRSGVLIVSAVRLNASDVAVSGTGGVSVRLRTRIRHDRIDLGKDTYAVAIETETPGALADWFQRRNATVTRRDFDGDGVESVVASLPGERQGYLVVHDMHLEVNDG